ncbi:hypothetical protein RZS08_51810, partial [Arthrospira platensis SPKY1]|nr:hypothetical protein [Arthrospira platensis SPKY1]
MLDWDRSIAKQSANVKRALSCIGLSTFKSKLLPGGTGGDFYRRLAYGGGLEGVDIPSERIGPKAASHFLYGIGIKGIKY